MTERRVTIDDMTVGLAHTHRVHMTQAMIDQYAGLTGDFNPVHVDPVYALRPASAGASPTAC